jgi:ABC-type antimicrobial peptide transport system permease subunit
MRASLWSYFMSQHKIHINACSFLEIDCLNETMLSIIAGIHVDGVVSLMVNHMLMVLISLPSEFLVTYGMLYKNYTRWR